MSSTLPAFIGRRDSVGVGIEAVAGTAVAPQAWQRQLALTLDQKTTVVKNTSAMGRVEDINDSAVTEEWVEGSVNGKITDATIGYFLANMFGLNSATLHSGESAIYDNTFTVVQSALPPYLTFARWNPVRSRRFALGTLTDFEIDVKQNDWVQFTATVQAKSGQTSTETVAYAAEHEFTSKHVALKVASSLANLTATALASPVMSAPSTATTGGTLPAATYYYVLTAINGNGETLKSNEVSQVTTGSTSTVTLSWAAITGATGYKLYRATSTGAEVLLTTLGTVTTFTDTGSLTPGSATPPTANTTAVSPIQIKSIKMKISRKTERFTPVGAIDPVSFDPNAWGVTGTIVARYTDTTLEDIAFANTAQAMSLALTNTDVTIGTAANPALVFTAPQMRLDPQTLDNKLDQTISQTFNFTLELNTAAGYMLQAVLTNAQNGYAHA
jgi:hypothetical protein